ncbi:MAG TPA: HEAT repeat domain-containing protein, partial [bacterium]|nr:HEAT repeat domain-containing protein [bacterium]
IIPTMDEAKIILSGKDNWDEQLQTLLMIEKMGMKPKPLESQLIAIFSKRNLEHKETLTEMQSSAIITLGHLKTSAPAAIDFMMASLMSYDYRFSDNAKTALIQIGTSAVPKLISKLQSLTDQDGGLMYIIAEILGKIGPDARSAKTILQQSLGKTNNSDVRYAIESALQAIEGQ